MEIEQEKDLVKIKDQYLNSLRKSSIDISNGNQVQVQDFLYTVILNKQYDQLIQYFNGLNKEICKAIIYGHNLPSTSSALNILYAFLYFYIGSKLKIEELIDKSNDSPWDCFFNMCLYFIEGNVNKTKLYKEKFEQILTLSNKTNLALDSRASETKLQNLRNANQIVDFLIHIVYKDNSVTEKYKKKHFVESYNFLKEHNMIDEINDKTKKLKINIINAYLTKDYEYLKNIEVEDKNSLVIITYSLIQIDYRQFSVFLSRFNDKDRNYHIQQIKNHVDAVDRDYFKLVLVGRSLKKIGEWEKTIDLYEELIKSNEKILSKQKYNIFLYYTVCKIKFMKGEYKSAQETCKLALEEIDKFQKSKQLFYQPNTQRFIQMELLFLNIVLKYISKDNKSKKKLIDQIKEKLLNNDNNNLRRNLNLLNQQFIEDIENKDISKIQYSEQSFVIIRSFLENQIQERQYFIQNQNKSFFQRQNKDLMNSSVILEQNKKKDIKLKTQCLLELFIITQFLKNQEYQIVYYLNTDYLTLFLNMITLKDLAIEPVIQAQIFRFFGEYDQCFRIAQSLNNYKLMAEVHLAQMNDILAIEYYEKVQDAESHFLLGYLYFNKSDKEQDLDLKSKYYDMAIDQLQLAKLYSKIYKNIIRRRMISISFQEEIKPEKDDEQMDVSTIILGDSRNNIPNVSNSYIIQEVQNEEQTIYRKSTQDITQSKIFSQPSRSNSTTISLNYSDFKGRPDISFFCKEVKIELALQYPKLFPQIEKFASSTRRYEIESKKLIEGMQIMGVIGSGGFGRVNKVIFEGKEYASKISSITFNSLNQDIREDQMKKLYYRINEINILSEIQDYKIPYVIQNKHIGFKFAQLNDEGLKCIKIFNLSPLYKPFSVIQDQNDKEKLKFAEKIAICLKQLQIRRISHQDIKPENVLVDEYNSPVLIDFGISISNFRSTLNGSKIFTQVYVDPELENSGKKSRKNDVYSFGITLYDLFTCRRPFDDLEYYLDVEFLSHKTHKQEIAKITIQEVQQLIHNCTQANQNKRYSISQVLYQFLMINTCRNDIIKLLKVFMIEFQDIDISDQEYELIKEFQQISLQMALMDSLQIQQVEQVNDTLFKCKYQEYQLIFHKYEIVIQNKQLAFKQILQCMRFIRNHVYLNKNNVNNVNNITEFYNFRLILQENGQEKSIQFDIYSFDNAYKSGYSKSQEQLITLLQTIEQINEHGIFIKALANEFLQYQNETPIITNLLYSFRYQDDSFKNQLGWTYVNMIQDNSIWYEVKNLQITCLKTYFEQFILNMKTRSTLRKSVIKKTQFEETLEYIIDNIHTFETIFQIINLITQPQQKEQIVQEEGQ